MSVLQGLLVVAEMNENTGKDSSCLAITTEKRAHRPGGCVGIFFQLFDWNRKFAKKKLFSRKLLPPIRAKHVCKKFKGDEKMPISKLHLIADENSGGFPSVKKNGNRWVDLEKKHEMRAPGLVARLMGLESMPSALRDKSKKPSSSGNFDNGNEKFVGTHIGYDKEVVNLEKRSTKQESRPQKLQKTGPSERRAVSRFGAEALQIKSVLSRSRKYHHHHPKFVSPVKSPRISSGKNVTCSSRLIGAATRILEPGFQATSRAKCALTHPSSRHYPPKDEIMKGETRCISSDMRKECIYNVSLAEPLMGQASCKNCGNVVGFRKNAEEQPPAFLASNFVNASSQDLGWSKSRPPASSHEQDREAVCQTSKDQDVSFVAKEKDNTRTRNESITEGQGQSHLLSQTRKPQKDESSHISSKHRTQTQDHTLLGRDRIPPRSKQSNPQSRRISSAGNAANGNKDFVALNRNVSGRTRQRSPTKADGSKFDLERKAGNGRDDSLPHLRTSVRKRRTINASAQAESIGSESLTFTKQRNILSDAWTGKSTQLNTYSMNGNSVKSRLANRGDGRRADGKKETDVISFTFNSPIRQKTRNPTEMEGRRGAEDGKMSSQRPLPLRRDALGAILEQKLRELTCQEDDEFTTGAPAKRSTAIILQELISALTAEQHFSQNGNMFNKEIASTTKTEMERLIGSAREGHHLSPGSVLEASFSSSSLDESPVPGHRLCPEAMDYSYNQLQPLRPDADLLDSATSLNKGKTVADVLTDFVGKVSKTLDITGVTGARLTGNKLDHARGVVLNAELLFGTAASHYLHGTKGFLITSSLLDELESFARSAWTNSDNLVGLEDTKEGNQLRRFLFDIVIECLDSKYVRYCNSGFRSWSRLPLCMNAKRLIPDVAEEVRRWRDLAVMAPDEIIDWEMSHSLGKWTDFDIEAFETGTDIDEDIVETLVEEIVLDLMECSSGSL